MKVFIPKKHGVVIMDYCSYKKVMFKYSSFWTAKNMSGRVYVYGETKDGERSYIHRFIMNTPLEMVVDHINGNTLDNSLSNLRNCSLSENNRNSEVRKCKKSSKYKGVFWCNTVQKWKSRVIFNKKSYHTGTFKLEVDAAKAYNKKAFELFGQFSKLNDIPEV